MDNPFDQFDTGGAATSPLDTALANEGISGPKADFIRSIYQQESSSGKNTTTSSAGAVGGMQIVPATFASVADQGWDINNPVHNAQAGTRYASQMWDKAGGDPKLAAAGYYGGPGGLEKARKGIAVRDPRNPSAPSTLQYGEQVAGRMGAPASQGNPFDQFDKSPAQTEGNPFDQFDKGEAPVAAPPKAESIVQDIIHQSTKAGKNILAVADTIASLPAAVLGPTASATARWVALAHGAEGKDSSQFGFEFGQKVASALSNPIDRMLSAIGKSYSYDETGVGHAMSKVSEVINHGADWLQEHSNGVLTKEDALDLTNSAALLAAPGAIRLTSKALMASGKAIGKARATGEAPESAVVREEGARPAALPPNATPADAAKTQIEEITGVNARRGANKEFRSQQRADARAAFSDDAAYGAYLNDAMNREAIAKDEVQAKADSLEETSRQQEASRMAAERQEGKVPTPPEKPTYDQIKPILDKPGFQRTPEDILKLRQFNRQGGQIDPKVLARMAAVGIGATAGAYLDPQDKMESAILGGVAGFLGAKGIEKAATSGDAIRTAFSPSEKISIKEFGDSYEVRLARGARQVWQQTSDIIDLAPSAESQAKITHWLQGDKSIPLTDKEYAAATKARAFFDTMGQEGVRTGVLGNLLPDYVTNLWDLEGKNAPVWNKITTGMSPNSKFNLQRKIASLAEGKKLGLTPVTENISTIMGIYGNSLIKTMANRQLTESLKNTPVAGSTAKLMMPVASAPKEYVQLDHPSLQNLRVHPDIAPSLKFFYNARDPKGIVAAIEALNFASKRAAISFSLFHNKSLLDAFIASESIHPKLPLVPNLLAPLKLGGMLSGTDFYLQQLRKGGLGDIIDKGLEGGLKFGFEKGKLVDEDVGGNFYEGMRNLQAAVDSVVPGAGKAIKGIENVNHAVDTITWERLHPSMKLNIFAKNYETLRLNNAAAHAKDPSIPLKTSKQIAEISADYANSSFGGLNWRRMAENAKTQLGREAAMKTFGPEGRRLMQFMMFAPDWTISTTMAALKAFGKGSEIHGKGVLGKAGAGLKGLVSPQELADLHRQYLIRSAVYYLTAGNALNYAMSGHSVFQNKDPTFLELGDGRRMQFSKHAMEPIHWLEKPGQTALNKVGLVPGEIATQLSGREYLSTTGAPEMDTSGYGRLKHAGKRFLPFSASSKDLGSSVAGSVGFPIYGMTEEQKRADRQQRNVKRQRREAERAKQHKGKKDKFFE